MLALKRLGLLIFVLAFPPLTAVLLYFGSTALLAATNRVIDPQVLREAAIADWVAFTLFCLLEAKNRWSS
ncbi:MAG TPA: hypothetical protein VGH02_05225 [Rhizomicrobium sp.]|jgi:hypothetical protein